MAKFMLVTATYWNIETKQFDSFDNAREQMLAELEAELRRCGELYELAEVEDVTDDDGEYDEEAAWEQVKALEEYDGEDIGEYGFTFRKDHARCELQSDHMHQWKIAEIQ